MKRILGWGNYYNLSFILAVMMNKRPEAKKKTVPLANNIIISKGKDGNKISA
jgi:hypothetical protein